MLLPALLAGAVEIAAVGVVLAPRPERSVALLRSEGRTRAAAVGETAFGARVELVASDRVVVQIGDERHELRLRAATPTSSPALVSAPTALGPVSPVAPAGTPPAPVRNLERQEVQRRLSAEIPQILAQTTILPVYESGVMAGFTITRMPDSGLLSDAGLRAGDVLTQVNDTPIDSLATLIGLWPRLQNEASLRAVVLRNGQPLTLTVNVK